MSNPDTAQPQPVPQNATIADTLPQAPAPTPTPKDEGNFRLLTKVAQAFQMAVQWLESRDEARYYVVVERTMGPGETIECPTSEDLRQCVAKLRAEICERRRNRENVDMRISMFHGVRYYLQKWPHAALVHGKDVIPLDPLTDLEPVIDPSGSLYDPPSLINRSLRRNLRSQSEAADMAVGAGPAGAISAAQSLSDDDGPEEGLPPGQDPQIIE